ncbi:SRPBCC family protein [Solwaraspora sp. WMMD1047]|uniref:SRPBCC family protein n=1 Tax=Solwaraspora sp. WMMD1047 TaxID=3016102 RepID=UPI002415BE21|nr:SRPBCC family protein [Solwaraspora sp. WMMD1047]MDG4833313.1 SRPBCC family protein [Solwaraspora sp. WMMD1047]
MSPNPTGRITATSDGYDLVLTRRFRAPADDVWASIVEPERTARWFGTWRGEGAPGRTIQVQMGFEEGTPWSDMRIDACEAPHRLAVSTVDEAGEWLMEVRLTEQDGWTQLELVQHLTDPGIAEHTGPGWEYYLDMLVAAREDRPLPDFADYYPAQAEYFLTRAKDAAAEHPAG